MKYTISTLTADIQNGQLIFSAFGPMASRYLYSKRLSKRLVELFHAAKTSNNRFFVLQGETVIAAQSTESGALQYVGDNGQEVLVDFGAVLPSLQMLERVVRKAGATEEKPIVFGNVEFWIDCKWIGTMGLSYNIPVNQWDAAAITSDITRHMGVL